MSAQISARKTSMDWSTRFATSANLASMASDRASRVGVTSAMTFSSTSLCWLRMADCIVDWIADPMSVFSSPTTTLKSASGTGLPMSSGWPDSARRERRDRHTRCSARPGVASEQDVCSVTTWEVVADDASARPGGGDRNRRHGGTYNGSRRPGLRDRNVGEVPPFLFVGQPELAAELAAAAWSEEPLRGISPPVARNGRRRSHSAARRGHRQNRITEAPQGARYVHHHWV